jgi:hypothetical protein
MPCTVLTSPDGKFAGWACGRGRAQACKFCRIQTSTKLCDFVVGPNGKTCDAPICDKCATSVGENLDYCPTHKNAPKPAQQNLFAEAE